MKNRHELEVWINSQLILFHQDDVEEIQKMMTNKYQYTDIDSGIYVAGITPLTEMPINELFWLANTINNYNEIESKNDKYDLQHSFSTKEIAMYNNQKFVRKENNIYPIEFSNILQVSDDQWVGVISVDKLYDLYNNQVIRYNTNTQRNMVMRNGEYKINIKKKSVDEIRELMERKLFIPNALSLNINLDDPDVDYIIEQGKIILLAGQVDIIDGYHRFRAIILEKIENPAFEYSMIVNLMNFNEEKANNYIAQEDKRNKIDKQYVKSLDSSNPVNIIVKRLNEDSDSYLYGQVGVDRKIRKSYLFALVDSCFAVTTRREAMMLTKEIKDVFNKLGDNGNIEYGKLDDIRVTFIIRAYSKHRSYSDVVSALKNMNQADKERFTKQRLNKPLLNYVDGIVSIG